MLLLKFLVFVLVCAFYVVRDLSRTKKPFDDSKKTFKVYLHWWKYRWDNLFYAVLGGGVGFICASEWGAPVLKGIADKFEEIPDLTHGTIDLTSVAVCTYIGIWLTSKFSK